MFEHFAYLDPSTGSLFIQSIIGSIAGLGFIFRRTITNIVQKFATAKSRRSAAVDAE